MSFSVVRIDEWDEPVEVIGAFTTMDEARAYALRSFYLGRDAWEHKPCYNGNFVAVPWTPREGDYYKESRGS